MDGRAKEDRDENTAHRTESVSWWVGLSREQFQAAAQTRVFNTSRWRFIAPDFAEGNDPSYRDPFVHARNTQRSRKEAGFDMGTSFGGVVLVRDDPRETSYDYDAAPIEQNKTVRQAEADRYYLSWGANQFVTASWHQPEQRFVAVDAAANLRMLVRLGFEPHWTPEQRGAFEHWCEEHNDAIQQVLEMIE